MVRDLVIEMSDFMRKLVRVKPWIIREQEKPLSEGEYLQTPDQLDAYKQFSMCINCMLCYAACPVYRLDPLFSGPAAIAQSPRLESYVFRWPYAPLPPMRRVSISVETSVS